MGKGRSSLGGKDTHELPGISVVVAFVILFPSQLHS